MTKETLLDWGFIDNDYLTKYLDFINVDRENLTGLCHYHHCKPICSYRLLYDCTTAKAKSLSDRDFTQELVKLTYWEHAKAHWLLIHCSAGLLQEKLIKAFSALLKPLPLDYKDYIDNELTAEQYAELQKAAEWAVINATAINGIARIKCGVELKISKDPLINKSAYNKAKWAAINELTKKLWEANKSKSYSKCRQEAKTLIEAKTKI